MFTKFSQYVTLEALAKNPVDLTKKLSPRRISEMVVETEGFKLLYGTERVDNEVMTALFAMAREAKVQEKMAEMQGGAIMNTGEHRQVLHTAMREMPPKSPAAKQASRELDKLEEFLRKTAGKFTDIVQIGIGGSDLGPRAMAIALDAYHLKGRRAHFISNVDPDDVTAVLKGLDLRSTLFVVVSKSGTTLETLTNEEFVRQELKKAGITAKDHFVAVTGEKSPMDNPSRYLASFYIWDFIGGRYSSTSMVGCVTLGFLIGMDHLRAFLRGAHEMDLHALHAPVEKNLPLISALLGIWNRNFLGHPTVAIIPYSQALSRFPAHLQQLDMESNGKHVDTRGKKVDCSTGPVIWGEPGTNGQHSFYQLIHQGTDIIPLEFIGFQESQYGNDPVESQKKLLANLFAQSIALAQGHANKNPHKDFPGNRPNRILLSKKLDPHRLGALLAYYEHKVVFQGFMWGINSFDQEGVQLGKTLALKILDGGFDLGEAYLAFCNM